MIWILFALLAAIPWAVVFIFQFEWMWAAIASGVVGLIALGYFIYSRIKAKRSASALEKAIAEQGKQQVMNARPEKRAEIQALQKQITDGISALKSSKLGGKKRGASALYSLPWYAIIGPPGAGKTTALKHSGLVFPYADTAVRGVGGTRNCDWWFTNEAILLDTAGRYATEHEDQSEWLAFLDMLRKYRSNKPLNGLLVAISVTDIIDSNEAQLEDMGKKLRARIDEVMTKLRMQLPVYLLITKVDLVAGFSEFFGDLRKSERSQAWGATLNLKENKDDPGAIFAREFDLMVHEIHKRAVKRMARERNRMARESIFHFPLELAGIKRNLQDLIAQVFMVNAFQGTPQFRGFYFTSGTQEGTPLNRVLQRMGAAMGIQHQQTAQQAKVESKSYFLHDMFMKVVFPDADVAARSASEIRRQRLVRIGVSAAACALAFTLAIPSIISFVNNRTLLSETQDRAKVAATIKWNDGNAISPKLDELDPLLQKLQELESHELDGPPLDYRWLMYSGDEVYRPAIRVYVANMQVGFVQVVKQELEAELNKIKGERYYAERLKLKKYLMLSDVEHLDVEWATGQYTALWAKSQEQTASVSLVKLKERMKPHVRFYFQLLKPQGEKKKPRATPVPANPKVVKRAREVLTKVPVRERYYSLFVGSVLHELYDPAGDYVRSNMKYPPISLETMFADRSELLQIINSRKKEGGKGYYEVEGPYTHKGRYQVLTNIDEAKQLLEREQWVVPLSEEERGDKIALNIKRLASDYDQRYINSWKDFLLDVNVKTPANIKEAIKVYKELQKPEWPYLRILRAVHDHTQWKGNPFGENKAAGNLVNRKINRTLSRRTRGIRFNLDVKKVAGKTSSVPGTFKKTVHFGVPEAGTKGPLNKTALAQYMERVDRLRRRMLEVTRENPDASVNIVVRDLQNAVKETEALLQPTDDMARRTLLPILQLPLNVGGRLRLTSPLLLGSG